ncbi:long-chain fatty acid--CoA ligase [Sphingopyxis sp. BSN-002]|uniref:long-chain-fatty-acid--CoA ligase n=1 Tax=Sphingopyxis sp. BSN-002 TaxID=2911495 RepID=UPI001EDAFAFF|nr:long-chain fatty acid--CoA ligase [Sphingopyxis sp. BSN-002]UKK83593.1 long-chain fatty acid--CoA ligase [Sphingopyxis sp. BSN-002]
MNSLHDWSHDYRHPTPWDQPFEPLSLPDMLAASVARKGDAPMLDFMGRRFSYAEVASGVARVARGLQLQGVGKGSRVGLFLPNVPHYVAAYYGALAVGATVVNFSPLYTVAELEAQVEDSGTDTLVTISAAALLPTALAVLDGSSLKRLVVGSVAGGLPAAKSVLYRLFKKSEVAALPDDPRVIRFSALADNDGKPEPVAVDPETDIALIQYTGGTTGTPKGAKLTHQNLTANARQVNAIDPDHDAGDRILGVLPFFHVFANTCVLNRTVLNGGMIAMLPRFDAKAALQTITRTKATALPGVPTMYQALLDHPDIAKTDFSSLRVCISGGAPMPAELREKFIAATGASLVEGYGLTESSGVVATNPYDGPVKPGTIGQPLPATHIRLLDKEDPTKDAPAGEPGELAVKGPQIMQGYWNRADADKDSFTADGWLRTGDVATIEADGYIRIVDRLKDMIAVGGFKVYPSVIEAHLHEHPAVKEAIVLGVPDSYRGEVPKAFVTLEEGFQVSGEALAAWLNPQLGKHERVSAVEVRLNLPKTMIGKLDRKALRAEAGI